MSLTYRKPASTYALYYASPQARTGRATRAVVRWMLRMLPRVARAFLRACSLAWRRRGDVAVVSMAALVMWLPIRDADKEADYAEEADNKLLQADVAEALTKQAQGAKTAEDFAVA